MQAVESITQLAVSAGNAAIGIATLKQQAAMAGIGMLQHATGTGPSKDQKGDKGGNTQQPSGSAPSTQPNAANISDPALLEVNKVLQLAVALQMLVCGGPNGGPDWDKIRGNVCFRVFLNELIADAAILRAPPILSRAGCTSR